jgi:hypothetical protein
LWEEEEWIAIMLNLKRQMLFDDYIAPCGETSCLQQPGIRFNLEEPLCCLQQKS